MIILSKLCKTVVLRLSSTKLFLIALNESNNNQISVWSVLDQQSFFKDYDMIGETESNEIFFSLPIGMYVKLLFDHNNLIDNSERIMGIVNNNNYKI